MKGIALVQHWVGHAKGKPELESAVSAALTAILSSLDQLEEAEWKGKPERNLRNSTVCAISSFRDELLRLTGRRVDASDWAAVAASREDFDRAAEHVESVVTEVFEREMGTGS